MATVLIFMSSWIISLFEVVPGYLLLYNFNSLSVMQELYGTLPILCSRHTCASSFRELDATTITCCDIEYAN